MENVKKVMDELGVLPKLHLGLKQVKGGAKTTGPHTVTFLAEPVEGKKKDFKGVTQRMLRFEVEENGTRLWWYVKVLNNEGEPNYLMERVASLKVGDVRVLEMMKAGMKNFIDIREVGAVSETMPDEGEDEEEVIQVD
jgi:hypothetical protein